MLSLYLSLSLPPPFQFYPMFPLSSIPSLFPLSIATLALSHHHPPLSFPRFHCRVHTLRNNNVMLTKVLLGGEHRDRRIPRVSLESRRYPESSRYQRAVIVNTAGKRKRKISWGGNLSLSFCSYLYLSSYLPVFTTLSLISLYLLYFSLSFFPSISDTPSLIPFSHSSPFSFLLPFFSLSPSLSASSIRLLFPTEASMP